MLTLTKWTLEDYHKMIEVGILCDRTVEFIKGDIIEMSPEKPLHSSTNHKTVIYLRQLLENKALVREAHPITLADSEPEPDVAVVVSTDELYFTRHPSPEDIYWLIEIADSSLSKDLGIKKQIYAEAGIKEYWVIDLINQKMHVFRHPHQEDYQNQSEFMDGIISPLAFPEIKIMVTQLLNFPR